jgi:hypothetical protein
MGTDKRTMRCPICGAENYSWRVALHGPASIAGLIGLFTFTLYSYIFTALGAKSWLTIPLGLFVLGSLLIARKWPLIGGVLLLLVGSLPIGLLVIISQHGFTYSWFLFWLIPTLPLLASGILFLLSWREGRRPSKEMGS